MTAKKALSHAQRPINAIVQIARSNQLDFPVFALVSPKQCRVRGRREAGNGDVVEISDITDVRRASPPDATASRVLAEATVPASSPLVPLTAIADEQWRALS